MDGAHRTAAALLASLWAAGCDFSAATKVFADSGRDSGLTDDDGGGSGSGGSGSGGSGSGGSGSGGSGSGGSGSGGSDAGGSDAGGSDAGGGDAGGGDAGGSDGSEEDPSLADDDGDGVTVGEGDCDDGDPAVYPGAEDGCDGRDQDCDGEIDEDARYEDIYEDNDVDATWLGDLSGGGSVSVDALLDSADDVDRFAIQTDDSSWSVWSMTVRLSNIPDGYEWRLSWVRADGEYAEVTGAGALSLETDDELFADDAGVWEIVVESVDGAPCDEGYLLTVDFSG